MPGRGRLRDEVESGLRYAMDARLAPHYERHMVDDCHYRTPDVVADALARFAHPHGSWLDLGAGSGLVGRAIVPRNIAVDLVAVDISQAMLDLIEGSPYVARHVADGSVALPFPEASFDGVLTAGVLEHVTHPRRLLSNALRVTKPGGALLFTYPPNRSGRTERCQHEDGLVSHDVELMTAEVGLLGMSVVHEVEFPAYLIGSRGWIVHRLVVGFRGS
jgi:ubiquinone/menaquinone biosynthesis C-methylase UbiE